MKLPRDIGPVHFVGIGGIGMSGIAEVMLNLGYVVQGSDQAEGANVKRLREKGVKIAIGHAAGNLADARVLVVSSAVKHDNPELVAARAQPLHVRAFRGVRSLDLVAEIVHHLGDAAHADAADADEMQRSDLLKPAHARPTHFALPPSRGKVDRRGTRRDG